MSRDLSRRELMGVIGGALVLPISAKYASAEALVRGTRRHVHNHNIEMPDPSRREIHRLPPLISQREAIRIARQEVPGTEWEVTEVLEDVYHEERGGEEAFYQCWLVTLRRGQVTMFVYIDAMTGKVLSVERFGGAVPLSSYRRVPLVDPITGEARRTGVWADVPFFSQVDSRWKDNALGFNYCGNSTIGGFGCYLSCLCMLYGKWGFGNVNPPFLNDWYNHWAFSNSGCGDLINRAQALQYAGQSYPSISRPYRDLGGINDVLPQLQLGRPVIAKVHLNSSCTSTHFMVIYGHDGSNFLCKDPLKDSSWQNQVLYGYCRSYRLDGYQ